MHRLKLLKLLGRAQVRQYHFKQIKKPLFLNQQYSNQTKFLHTTRITSNQKQLFENTNEDAFAVRAKNDPDVFGEAPLKEPFNEEDLKEEEYLDNPPLRSKRLSTKEYADIIKSFIRTKKVKEALDVLEIKMLKEDRAKPENYIYNLLMGVCGRFGYTKKAFSLFNQMKKRGLKVHPGAYTALFNACANSPWPMTDGLSRARHLREIMLEKRYEPNDTNYNAMIKAFGRGGDLETAFSLVDEMQAKGILLKGDTLNFLLQACISDKECGFRHALLVWRKFIEKNITPSIYSYNLLLRCVRDCGLGNLNETQEVIEQILNKEIDKLTNNSVHLISEDLRNVEKVDGKLETIEKDVETIDYKIHELKGCEFNNRNNFEPKENYFVEVQSNFTAKELTVTKKNSQKSEKEVNNLRKTNKLISSGKIYTDDQLLNEKILRLNSSQNSTLKSNTENRPNLIAKTPRLGNILSLSEVTKPEDRLLLIGGFTGFLENMFENKVTPNVKTFMQLMDTTPNTEAVEKEILGAMRHVNIKPDIDFYNMLIKRRSMRCDYEGAKEVLKLMKEWNYRPDLITYGVLALGCKSKNEALELLGEMKEAKYRLNIEILGSLLHQACYHTDFSYIIEIMKICKCENIKPNEKFMEHLLKFKKKCEYLANHKNSELSKSKNFVKNYIQFRNEYKKWKEEMEPLVEKESDVHPWQQFRENNKTDVKYVKNKEVRFKAMRLSKFKVKQMPVEIVDKSNRAKRMKRKKVKKEVNLNRNNKELENV